MTVITTWPAAGMVLGPALVASPQPTLIRRQEALLGRGCHTTVATVERALMAHTQAPTIRSRLGVVTPGALTGEIVFNPRGSSISLAGHVPPRTRSAFVCSESRATLRGLGPGRSHVVATLRRSFTRPGHYTVVFRLNARGRWILAQLAAADRAFREHHPHGESSPSIAFGVALIYTPAA